jgi:hypothetical protein
VTDTQRRFVPPHCPRTGCRFHASPDGWHWIHFGSYSRKCEPRRIPRFRCGHCRHTFSSQTFSTTYYLKRPDLLEKVFHRLVAGSGCRQITREARCAHSTVVGLAARLGRHAMLFQAQHRPQGPVDEPIVIDGFEGFAYSQYQPLYLNLVVGSVSHFTYGFTQSTLRRKGRMTEQQRRRRAALEREYGRPDPKAIELDTAAAVRMSAPAPQPLIIRSDEHTAYPRALRRLAGYVIRHERTPSVEARTTGNPLFPVNLMDLLLRHNSANHKRETIAFSKRHQASLERAALLVLWRNYSKPFSENHGGGTPAMRVGVRTTPWSVKRLLAERLFPSRVRLPAEWRRYYERRIPTVGIRRSRLHQLKLAF